MPECAVVCSNCKSTMEKEFLTAYFDVQGNTVAIPNTETYICPKCKQILVRNILVRNILEYKGYLTKIEYSPADQVFHGKIEGIKDFVGFESNTRANVEQEFHAAVDNYIRLHNADTPQPGKQNPESEG